MTLTSQGAVDPLGPLPKPIPFCVRLCPVAVFILSFVLFPLPIIAFQASQRVILAVHTREGRFVRGIKPDQLQIEGSPVIRSLRLDDAPRRIAVVVDRSGSMKEAQRWRYSVPLLKEFLSMVGKGDQVALYEFATECRKLVPYTDRCAEVSAAIDSIGPPGEEQVPIGRRTMLGKALGAVAADTPTKLLTGDAIILVSDQGTVSDSYRDIVEGLGRAGVRLFLLYAQPSTFFPPEKKPTNPSPDISNMVRDLGGMVLTARYLEGDPPLRPDALHGIIEALYSIIRNYYLLELEFPSPPRGLKSPRINILSTDGRVSRDLRPEYPRWLLRTR